MSEPIRAFVAVEIPEAVRGQVADLASRLAKSSPAPVRWVKPGSMHLTLAFLGGVSGDFIEAAKTSLAQSLAGCRRLDARLSGLGAFPGPRRARVIWVGMDQGGPELCRVQGEVVRSLQGAGYVPENRPFSPHLTLGRLKTPADVTVITATEFRSGAFPVDRVILFQSRLQPSGPVYKQLARVELR